MSPRLLLLSLALGGAALPAAALAQHTDGYEFLQAVRDAKGPDVIKFLSKPGTTVVDTQDYATGETALHIVVKRGDMAYLAYLLAAGADPNLKDKGGNTPMMVAVNANEISAIDPLVSHGANINLANNRGETPLIRAVQTRNIPMVRELIKDGANADQTDNMAGMSARDYARQDTRTPALLKEIENKPRATAPVAGPHF